MRLISTARTTAEWKAYRVKSHTSTEELGQIAGRTKPGTLIIYHVSGRGSGQGRRTPDEQLRSVSILEERIESPHRFDVKII